MFVLPFSLNWVLLSPQVADHETVECFGPAMVASPKGTIAHLEAVAKRPQGFSRAGKAMEKMGSTFTRSCKTCGLPGAPNLHDINIVVQLINSAFL